MTHMSSKSHNSHLYKGENKPRERSKKEEEQERKRQTMLWHKHCFLSCGDGSVYF